MDETSEFADASKGGRGDSGHPLIQLAATGIISISSCTEAALS